MSVKIRLQRFGRKQQAYYHIVVADSRAPRDGKFIERLGNYNPNTNPATIEINFESAVKWLENGAQPTDTCRAILSYKGVLYKHHLDKGVKKGALTEDQATAKLQTWLEDKANRITGKKEGLADSKAGQLKAKLAHEAKVNEERAKKIAAKLAPVEEEVAETEEVAAETNEEVTAEVTPEATATTEEVTAEVVTETPAATEEVAPEVAEEAAPEANETPAE